MISYLILVLTVSLAICSPLEHDQSLVDDSHVMQERFFTGQSKELLKKLVQTLKKACDQGIEVFTTVINDPDVQGILNHMDSLTRKVAESIIQNFKRLVEKIDEATKENPPVQERGLKESSTDLLKRLTQILLQAYKKGSEHFYNVLNDPDVKGILDHLGPLARKMADSIIDNFKNLVNKIDEATKEDKTSEKRNLKESSTNLLKRLVQILIKACREGSEYFNKVLNDPDFQKILNHMDSLTRKVAESIIQNFKNLVERIDEATKASTGVEKRDFQESSYSLLKKLVRILTVAYEKGSKVFNETLEDPDVKAILGSLNSISRKAAEALIEQFKRLVVFIDNSTNNVQAISERDLKEAATSKMKNLIQILIQASRKGSEYFFQVLNDPDVVNIRKSLGNLNAKIVDLIVQKFVELFEKIDSVTKDPKEGNAQALSDWKQDSQTELKKLVQILIKAYRKGGEYFDKVVNDPDVQNILQHLGPLSRKVANSIIKTFKELFESLDNATKDNTFAKKELKFD